VAQHNLALCYLRGVGVKVDKAKAAQLWGQAAEQGLADAQLALGSCYSFGLGVEVNMAKAVQLVRQAAE
jgi:TPR repeat protein